MKKVLIILSIIALLFVINLGLFIQPLYAFYGKDLEVVNEILTKQEVQNQKIENIESSKSIYDQSIKNSIDALNVKNEGISFKSNYYDTALKLITIFGGLVVAVAIVLGFYKKGEIDNARKETRDNFNDLKEDFKEFKNNAKDNFNLEISKFKEQKKEYFLKMDRDYKNYFLSIKGQIIDSTQDEVIGIDQKENIDENADSDSLDEIKFE